VMPMIRLQAELLAETNPNLTTKLCQSKIGETEV